MIIDSNHGKMILQTLVSFISIFQIDLKDTKLLRSRTVELQQDMVYQRILGCLLILSGVLISTVFQQAELILLLTFSPLFLIPGMLLVTVTPALTIDFSSGKLKITGRVIGLFSLEWSLSSFEQVKIVVMKNKRLKILPYPNSGHWHYRIEITGDRYKFTFFTRENKHLSIIKKYRFHVERE